ncbi:L-xylulose reductase [Parasteatoda tepidariorum]|uniref:L-xylulose reductase n=1 Tax=Parasteatoda tepidariorum TaxID=114398 RepID=UPI0039BCD7FD
MKSRGCGGSIVNVSSIFSYIVSGSYSNYCTSKGAVDQITRCLAVEFGPYNIRVNAVNPTAIRTKMAVEEGMFDPENEYANDWLQRTPLKRFGEVDEVAYPILFLLSDKASMITGITMPIDGGLTISF